MKDKIIGLIQLQDCDNQITEILRKKNDGPQKIQELEKEFHSEEMKLQGDNDRLASLKKERRELEQDIQENENKAEKSKIKLDNVKSNKEYSAALKEIEDLNRGRSSLEDKVLQLMEEIESLEKLCIENSNAQEELKTEFERQKQEIEKDLVELEKKLGFLEKKREKYYSAIDQEILKKYLYIRNAKGGLAIGPVVNAVCQICYMGIPPQKFNELIRGESLMTCPNCNRIMYWGEDEYFETNIAE